MTSKQRDLRETIEKLDQRIAELQFDQEKARKELRTDQATFLKMENRIKILKTVKQKTIRFFRSIAAYLLGRRNPKHIYSKSFKIKHAMNRLKPYKYYLYNLGYIDSSLEDLKKELRTTKDHYLYRAILFELGLWYANEQSEYGAKESLLYLYEFIKDESDQDLIRQGTILLLENLITLGYRKEAKEIVGALMREDHHPDLYFARANTEKEIPKRLEWINKVYEHYQLAPISFHNLEGQPSYEDLYTKGQTEEIKQGPKVSVLLPAYNAEVGIRVAIESILNQSWQNLELLIIDDHSRDGTLDVIKEYAEKDNRISFYQTPRNSGSYMARNIGLKHARGKYVTVNDADDWSHAEKLAIQVKHLEENEDIIANTSEHARLTEELNLHRRGTPGNYIFSNMSSLMFRREEILEKLGYWDSVRFAADGEFKRRLIRTFGADRIIDLPTGPLSLPRQSVSSLTASSAFGYNGFFMGVRKEYVASFSNYHAKAENLYYPKEMEERPYPVPEPMWPKREEKPSGSRHFEIVMAGDFSQETALQNQVIKEINVHKKLGIKTGIVLKSCYNMIRPKELNPKVRQTINGEDVQVLVYGEEITCDVLVIRGHSALQEEQEYLPHIKPHMVVVLLDDQLDNIRLMSREVMNKYGKSGIWFGLEEKFLSDLQEKNLHDLRYIKLARHPWSVSNDQYEERLKDWMTNLPS